MLTATDDEDYSETECPTCRNKGLKRETVLSKEENMKRIEKLWNNLYTEEINAIT